MTVSVGSPALSRWGRARAGGGRAAAAAVALAGVLLLLVVVWADRARGDEPRQYPWHENVVATTFWVGEIFDPNASDGSQRISTYDARWYENYGGCDGQVIDGVCHTEARVAAQGYHPTSMQPQQNPFYLDVPYDDLNDPVAFANRCEVIPWANDPGYAGRCADHNFSYMKNRWVELRGAGGAVCYGQIQDAGPGEYRDAAYVFGSQAPANTRYNGAGLDVSPALNGCLGMSQLNGSNDRVSWRFVEEQSVPDGPWKSVVTTTPVVR